VAAPGHEKICERQAAIFRPCLELGGDVIVIFFKSAVSLILTRARMIGLGGGFLFNRACNRPLRRQAHRVLSQDEGPPQIASVF